MTAYWWIALALVPALVVFAVLARMFGKRFADTTQWLADVRDRLERLEKETAHIAAAQKRAARPDPVIAETSRKTATLAQSMQSRHDEVSTRLQDLETLLHTLERKLEALQPGQAADPPQKADLAGAGLFSSPIAQEVIGLLKEGVSQADIARKTGLQVGEIELIRALKYFADKDGGKP